MPTIKKIKGRLDCTYSRVKNFPLSSVFTPRAKPLFFFSLALFLFALLISRCYPQFCASRSWVLFNFFNAGHYWHSSFGCKWPDGVPIKILFVFAFDVSRFHISLYHPIFQRVVRNYDQPSARLNHIGTLKKQVFQHFHFRINLDPQCLKNPRQKLIQLCFSRQGLYFGNQVFGSFYRCSSAVIAYPISQLVGLPQLSIVLKNLSQLFFRVGINYFVSCEALPFSHSHIQSRITANGKPAFGNIKLMRGHTEIGQ